MTVVNINGRWPLNLPAHRAERVEWPHWEAARLAAMRGVINVGSVVYDIGGEEGDFPALWSSWGADVVIVEPNPRVWPNIRWIFEANHLRDPLLCFEGFCGDEARGAQPGVFSFDPWPESAYGEVIGDHGFCQLNERPDLPATTIDSLASVAKAPTVITIDVEGSELHVLKGSHNTLQAFRPHVFVSIHPEFMAEQYDTPDGVNAICRFMENLGYRPQFLAIDHEHHYWFRP